MLPEARVTKPVTESEAARLARELFGLEGSARSLPGEYDDNFQLTASDGRAYVLKVMHVGRERPFVDMQCRALQHLARRAPHLAVPRVCPTRSGEAFKNVRVADGSERLVWLLTFLPGTVLAEVRPHEPDLLESLGRLLGEMDAALEDFAHPSAERELKWDLARAGWIREYLLYVSDAPRRVLVGRFLALYEAEVVPALPRLRRSVVYGDANDHNVLVRVPWPQPRKVAGVIDFGDMHYSIIVSEVRLPAHTPFLERKIRCRLQPSWSGDITRHFRSKKRSSQCFIRLSPCAWR